MNVIKSCTLFCVFLLIHQWSFANSNEPDNELQTLTPFHEDHFDLEAKHSSSSDFKKNKKCHCHQKCQFGGASFLVTDPLSWYTINTLGFPNTVLLSLNRNKGFTQGHVSLTPSGLVINKTGNYFVIFSAILRNPDPTSTIFISVFLSLNNTFDPNDPLVTGVVTLPPESIDSAQSSQILPNIPAGTTLSLIAANSGVGTQPQAVQVVGWNINLFKIPCK